MKEKNKFLGFWKGCACDLGHRLFEVRFPFFFDEFLITQPGAEKELLERKRFGYIQLREKCTCGSDSGYIIFKETDLNLVLKTFPILTQLAANYEFFKERGYYDEEN